MTHADVEALLGRKVEVLQVSGGFVIDYFNFNTPPPPVGITQLDACTLFVEWFKGMGLKTHKRVIEGLEEENTDADEDNPSG
jgi:hypothetical protein